MGSDVNFFSSFFNMIDSFFSYVCFGNFFLGFGMNCNIFSFLVIGISFGFGMICFSLGNMGGSLFKISFNFNRVGLNGGSSGLMGTSVGFFLSVFSVSFSLGGNMSLFLSSILNIFSSMWFFSFFLCDFSLCFLVISNGNLFGSVDGSFFGVVICLFCNMFYFFMSFLGFSFVYSFFFSNRSFLNFSVVDDFSNCFLLRFRWFWCFHFKIFCFFFHFFFLDFFLNFFIFFKMRKDFAIVMVMSSSSTLW